MIIVKSRRRRSASVSSSGRGVETILLIAVLLLRSANSLVLEYYDVDAPFVLGVKTTYEPGDDSDKVTVDMKRPVSLKTKPGESHNVLRRISIRLPTSEMNLLWNAGKHVSGFKLAAVFSKKELWQIEFILKLPNLTKFFFVSFIKNPLRLWHIMFFCMEQCGFEFYL